MNASAISQIRNNFTVPVETPLQRSLRHWNIGAFVSAILGAVCGLGGIFIGALSVFGPIGREGTLAILGPVLIAVSFPLFFITAHCLDKVDAADKAIRLEYCRQHGLREEDS